MTKKMIAFAMTVGLSLNAFAEATKVEFSNKCTKGKEITISGVGDILLHGPLQAQAFASKDTFKSLWPAMIPVFNTFDLSYANFEGPSAEGINSSGKKVGKDGDFTYDKNVYTSFPMFNYHPRLVADILASGIDVVSTANNHALDRRQLGADMTTEVMRKQGLPYTGTRPRNDVNNSHGWHAITEKNGFRIAWLACTFSTNGFPDSADQVLGCYDDEKFVLNYVHALAKDPSIDAVIVTPHWGVEYTHQPAAKEVKFGRTLIDAGATAVIATHPHVIQPWEKYVSPVTGEEGLIVYATGNFVNCNFGRIPTQVGLMVGLKLVQVKPGEKLKIKAAKYTPLMMKRQPYRVEPVTDDSTVGAQYSSIWKKMYPAENRISDLKHPFGDECSN